MRRIPLLAVDAATTFDSIAAAKRTPTRPRMRAIRAEVIDAYEEYEEAAPEVGTLVALDINENQQAAMRHAYNVETQPMLALRGALLGRPVVFRCPFCGIGESSTLDHYLPKEQYPEFAIFPLNLVPSCGVCNNRKRDHVLIDGTDVRMFLHPCFDTIPDEQFLVARTRIEADALVISFRLRRPEGMAMRTYRHLQSHFEVLNLADRYRRMSLDHLGEFYPALRRAYGDDEDAGRVVNELFEAAEDAEEVAGYNFWRAKLYRALAVNNAFCDGGFELARIQYRPN